MFSKVSRYYKGRVYIKASGEGLERFINQAVRDGIIFYNGKKLPDSFRAEVSTEDFKRLRKAAREAEIKIAIRAKYGFPFVALRWQRRKGLIVGLFLIFTALTVLSQFVISIEVEGNDRVPTEQIIVEAEKLGLKTWVLKNNLDLEEISKKLQENNPDLIWATIDERGTNMKIRVVEKTLPEKVVYQGDLIAAKTGFVDQVIVIQGIPVVKEGDMVKQGQVLIKAAGGMMEYSIDARNPNEAKQNLVDAPAAKGFVRGRVWYSVEKEVLLSEDFIEKTGRFANGWGIKIKDRVIMITNQKNPYEQAIEETISYALPSWRNWRFPVEVIKVCYEETKNVQVERTVSEARQLAEAQAREELHSLIPAEAKTLRENVRIRTSENEVEYVRVEAETFEELAVYRQ
ncbi:MAG: sporulation protein YqfD [Peptococcaceae bacterium]|jgi:similar to stage IV sporulation protein|nr:sporulation protein YqfD [Peptococcaceae bacterium]